jgi:CubicO group peptidase (beta-lactamase class C family)
MKVSKRSKRSYSSNNYSSVINEIENQIHEFMVKGDIPGLSIALVDGDRAVWAEGFGYTDRTKENNVTPETLFSLQSMTKTYTATTFLILASRGLVDLDDPLTKYYPEFMVNSRFGDQEVDRITFRHLLGHWAGFTHEAPVGSNFDDYPCTFEEHIRSIADTWLKKPVGKSRFYSNLGVDLVGYAMQRILKKPYPRIVKEELFIPLSMKDATFDVREAENLSFAFGHTGSFQAPTVQVPMIPSGGLYANVMDIAKFLSFHLRRGEVDGKQLIDGELLDEMYSVPFVEPHVGSGLALGIAVGKLANSLLLSHGGGGYGYVLNQSWLPEHDVGVVVLTNQQEHGFLHVVLAQKALELMLNAKQVDAPEPGRRKVKRKPVVGVEVESLQKLVGTYKIYRGPFVSISMENGKPVLNSADKSSELLPYGPMEFSTEDGIDVTFELDGDGKPISFLNLNNFVHAWYNYGPNDGPGLNERDWGKHVGTYRAKIYGNYIYASISVKNGWLYLHFFGAHRLKHYGDKLYFTPEGEALVLKEDSINFRNISLERMDIAVQDILDVHKVDKNSRLLHLGSLHSLAYALLETKGVDAALTLLDIIVVLKPSVFTSNLEPGYFDYYNQIGAYLYFKNEFADAKKCFERHLELKPTNERARTMLEKIEKKSEAMSRAPLTRNG